MDPGQGFGDHLEEKWKAIGATVPKKKEGQLWRWKEPTKMWMEKQGLPLSLLNEMKPMGHHQYGARGQFGAPKFPMKAPLRTSAPAFTPQAESVGTFNRPMLPGKGQPTFAQLARGSPKFPSSAMGRSRASTGLSSNHSNGLSMPTTPIENEMENRRKESEMRIIRMMMDQQELDRKELEMLRRELSDARAEIDRLKRNSAMREMPSHGLGPRNSSGLPRYSYGSHRNSGSPKGPVIRRPVVRRPEGNKVHTGLELAWQPTRNTPDKQKNWEMWGAKRLAAKHGQ